MIGYKEVIVTQNNDSTYKIEFIGCEFINKGETLEAKIVFPKVLKDVTDLVNTETVYDFAKFNSIATEGEQEIFTIYIPE